MKESDVDNLDVSMLKAAAPALVYTRDKILEQNRMRTTPGPQEYLLKKEYYKKFSEESEKQRAELRQRISDKQQKLQFFNSSLNRIGSSLTELPQLEERYRKVESDVTAKRSYFSVVRKQLSDLEASQNDRLKKLDTETIHLHQQIQSCEEEYKGLTEKFKQKEVKLTLQNQKIKDKDSEISNQDQIKVHLDKEIHVLEREQENKTKVVKELDSSLEKSLNDLNQKLSEKHTLKDENHALLEEKENLRKNGSKLNVALGAAVLFTVGVFSQAFLSKNK